ncbi:hypothetical protein ASE74_05305 [Pedobacter sp. Leaf216]|uniref:hypothetical protein n=1 Tax=Pedobacter sp. Leaf216 TaxID=1735684 RepID=UPI0006F5EEB4|nr:hypothetical protein [Pedobacter sp. Leaf216]KQM69417.1 hypothetical protein ASE74_05305 [Pedobacter sp. Leaf216]
MKRKIVIIALMALLPWVYTHAQDTIPHIKGKLTISVKKGTFECDLVISNMPRLKDYFFRLNSGMNIRYIKNDEPNMLPLEYEKSLSDTLSSGESSAYYIPSWSASGKYLPYSVRFNYVGMYPVITDTSSVSDWRGNIAFNGTSLRVDGIQSAWCPTLYDVSTDKRYEKVTYDLNITCNDCKVIYVNGSDPVYGTSANVKSDSPQDLTMFAGDFKSTDINNKYFLNPDGDDALLTNLEKELRSYQEYLQKKLNIPYKGKTVYIQTTPVSKNNSWLFVSYPSIIKVGWQDGMKSFQDKNKRPDFLHDMAHELSHYYFGTVRSFNLEIGDMIAEGFAEFLAMRITRDFMGDSLYQESLKAKAHAMGNLIPMPLEKIRSKSDYRNRQLYSYTYSPLLFSAIEKEIGEEKMWKWMNLLLQSTTVKTNYEFFEKTLSEAVADRAKFGLLREKYLVNVNTYQNVASTLGLPTREQSLAKDEKSLARKYYYFFFSRPRTDIGSTQNKTILRTDISELTGTQKELRDVQTIIYSKAKEQFDNASGSTGDFNTYETLELAQTALRRWLARYDKNGNMTVRIIN